MEALMRVVDKGVAEDCSKAGDVISICPDGWAWSPAELTNPDQWAFVHYFKRGELQITKAYAHVATNEVHSRVKMPTLHNNVADDYHREIEAAY